MPVIVPADAPAEAPQRAARTPIFSLPKAAASANVRPGVRLALAIGSSDGRACVVLTAEMEGAPSTSQSAGWEAATGLSPGRVASDLVSLVIARAVQLQG